MTNPALHVYATMAPERVDDIGDLAALATSPGSPQPK